MKSSRFDTQANPFQKEYAESALLQRGFNQQIIDDLVDYILRVNPSCLTRPIRVLDLCCGDGGATNTLLHALVARGVKVEKIIGLDISAEQISKADTYANHEPRLEFKVQNAESMKYQNEFDLVVSLFGLHWMENIDEIALKIHLALKPEGNVVYFVPLEKNDLFNLRLKTMASTEFKDTFSGFNIHPFINSHMPYLQSFSKYFSCENSDGIHGDQPVYFSESDFIRFLSSWMQEARYLQSKNQQTQYLSALVNAIPSTTDPTSDVATLEVKDEKKIRFLEKFFWFHGKRLAKDEVDYTASTRSSATHSTPSNAL